MPISETPTNIIELYLNRIANDDGAIPDVSLSRIEQYLRRIVTGAGPIPKVPHSRIEEYLNKIIVNEDFSSDYKLSRVEQYLYKILTKDGSIPEEPFSTIETYLANIVQDRSSSDVIPKEYQRVEYIGTNGDYAYLNLGSFIPTSPACICRFRVNQRQSENSPTLIGSVYKTAFIVAARTDVYLYTMIKGIQTTGLGGVSTGIIYDLSVNMDGNGTVELNGNKKSAGVGSDTYSDTVFYLGENSWKNEQNYVDFFEPFILYDNGEPKRNLIPCYRKLDGEIGMYDTVTETFLTNAGSGMFVKGPDVK